MRLYHHFLAACLAASCVGGAALADNGDSQSESGSQSSQSSQKAKDSGSQSSQQGKQSGSQASEQDRQADKKQGGQSQSRRQSDVPGYNISPSGWIRMAVDYDNDGRFDAVETIYTYDLEKARKSSRDRANREARSASDRQRARDRRGSDDSRSATKQQEKISGEIMQLRTEKLFGMNEPCLIARIRTEADGPAKAVLGPKSKLSKLKLAEGDQVTVSGRKGRVNDKAMLLAGSVSSGDQKVSVDMPSSRNAKRMKAELLSKRTAKFRNHDGQFVIAKVKRDSGKEATVNLGPKSKVDSLDLAKGDELKMIVRPAKVNGKPAMVADEIMANGKTIDVSPPKQVTKVDRNRDRQARSQSRSQADRQSSDSQGSGSQRSGRSDSSQQQQAALGIAVAETDEGVVILGVHPQSPAASNDLQVGDTIVSIDGKSIDSPQALVDKIRGMEPDENVKLKIRREGDEQSLQVKLTSRNSLMASLR